MDAITEAEPPSSAVAPSSSSSSNPRVNLSRFVILVLVAAVSLTSLFKNNGLLISSSLFTSKSTSTAATSTVLSLEDRQKYSRAGTDNNLTYWQLTKDTPTGWWPDEAWIKGCLTRRNQTKDVHTPFRTLPRFRAYRLGDCVKKCDCCDCPRNRKPKLWERLDVRRPYKTIAQHYLDQGGCPPHNGTHWKDRGNETLLDIIVDHMVDYDKARGTTARYRRKHWVLPPSDAMVIHLRLGDKLDRSGDSVLQMLQEGGEPDGGTFRGMRALKSVYEFLTEIVSSQASQVMIRGGSHFPNYHVKSKLYAYCLYEAVQEAGYQATIELDIGNPDHDFYFLSHAQKMIVTVGGYSRFVGHAVLRRGGIVFGRVF